MAAKPDTDKLKQNLQDQLDRLMQQLIDIEEVKDDIDEDEYEETKSETIEQLKEVKDSLEKIMKGNISLTDELGAMKLAIQAAISEAFKTPEVIRLFAKKQPGQLRERLSQIEREGSLGKLAKSSVIQQKMEILSALQRLDEKLTPQENAFLQEHQTEILKQFRLAGDSVEAEKVLSMVHN